MSEISTREFVLLNKDKMTVADAARELKISEAAVSGMCSRLGIKMLSVREKKLINKKKSPPAKIIVALAKKLAEMESDVINSSAEEKEEKRDRNADWQIQEHDRKKKERQEYKSKIKSELTQRPSPYGLADQIHGRKLAN